MTPSFHEAALIMLLLTGCVSQVAPCEKVEVVYKEIVYPYCNNRTTVVTRIENENHRIFVQSTSGSGVLMIDSCDAEVKNENIIVECELKDPCKEGENRTEIMCADTFNAFMSTKSFSDSVLRIEK